MRNTIFGLAALGLMAAPSATLAEAPLAEWSANAGVVSDYVYRGFSQSDGDVAVQGGIDFTYGQFYAGTWASTVDFGDSTDVEWDFYAGLTGQLGELDFDVGATYFAYVGAPDGADYDMIEFKAGLSKTFDAVTVGGTVYYSPDFFGADEEATYIEASVGYQLDDKWSLSAGWGRQFLDVGTDYNSWNAGVGYAFTETLGLDVRYWDSGVRGGLSDARVVVGLGVSF